MKEVGSFLEAEGYEFLAINSKIKRSPQYVCVKDKVLYFVVVNACLNAKSPKSFDIKQMIKEKNKAKKNQYTNIIDTPMGNKR